MTNYQFWDLKYYYQVHCARQKALGKIPVTYHAFCNRLKKMNLHDAIYSPRVESQVRDRKPKVTIADKYRRRQALNDENVQYIDFENTRNVEASFQKKKQNTIKIPKPNPIRNWWYRFISFFK